MNNDLRKRAIAYFNKEHADFIVPSNVAEFENFARELKIQQIELEFKVEKLSNYIECNHNSLDHSLFGAEFQQNGKFVDANPVALNSKRSILLDDAVDDEMSQESRVKVTSIENELNYLDFIAFAPDAFMHGDEQGHLIYVNQKAIELTEYSQDELRQMNFFQLFSGVELEKNPLRFDLLRQGENLIVERNMISKSGRVIPVEMSSSKKSNGSFQSFIRDISKRKLIEKKLAEEKVLMKTLIDNLPDAIYVKDINGVKLFANKVDWENQGFGSEEEVVGKTDFEIFPEKHAEVYHYSDQKVIADGSPIINAKEEIIFPDGTMHWFLTSKCPLYNNQGEIFGLVGINREITQQVEAEKKISLLSNGIEQSPASFIITDIEGSIVYVNKKFIDVTGYSFQELEGRTLRILKPEHARPEVYQQIWDHLNKGMQWKSEHKNRKKSGEEYWESVLISPIKGKNAKIQNFMVLSEDISLRKTMEADLVKAKERAEESDHLKSAFLNNMSHEIRTPLNAIVGFSELLSDSDLEIGEREYFFNIIQNSSDQLLHIINDIINVSTIDAGQMKANIKCCNLNNLLITLNEQFQLSNKKKEIRISYISTMNDDEAKVLTDETKLTQIISNLIFNALKFTEKGYVEFGVKKDKNQLFFWVKDSGIGIPLNHQKVIFDRFRQADSSINKKYGGSGLGLSIAKSFIELLGGSIKVESEVGDGAVFKFDLPYIPCG
ncbi:MAG: PAS domain S-box protein [Prolixibacteraceae bacterium]